MNDHREPEKNSPENKVEKKPKCIRIAFWWLVALLTIGFVAEMTKGGNPMPWTISVCAYIDYVLLVLCAVMMHKRNLVALLTMFFALACVLLMSASHFMALIMFVLVPLVLSLTPGSIRWLRLNSRFGRFHAIVAVMSIALCLAAVFAPCWSRHYISNLHPLSFCRLGAMPRYNAFASRHDRYQWYLHGHLIGICNFIYNQDRKCCMIKLNSIPEVTGEEYAAFFKKIKRECEEQLNVEISWSDAVSNDGLPVTRGHANGIEIEVFPEGRSGQCTALIYSPCLLPLDGRVYRTLASDRPYLGFVDVEEDCESLAKQRMIDQLGLRHPAGFCVNRNGLLAQHKGFDSFAKNMARAIFPPSWAMMSNDIMLRRRELYENYRRACESSATDKAQISDRRMKDEFETQAEFEARIEKDNRISKAVDKGLEKSLDDIVAFEAEHNQNIRRMTVNGLYSLEEALIFIPVTAWSYDAERRVFNVRGVETEGYEPMVTFQAFNFSLNGIRFSQFAKSRSINYEYKLHDGAWEHPRKFKEYKTQNPFLLVRLGACDFKVQSSADWITTMPFLQSAKSEADTLSRKSNKYVMFDGDMLSISRCTTAAKPIWAKLEKEARKTAVSMFRLEDHVSSSHGDVLPAVRIYADYQTPEGRAEIESVLCHFEKLGDPYYMSFCAAVRNALR